MSRRVVTYPAMRSSTTLGSTQDCRANIVGACTGASGDGDRLVWSGWRVDLVETVVKIFECTKTTDGLGRPF